MITRNFNLYLNAGHSVPLVINVNQYDSGEQWVFTLYNSDGTQYTPSTGAIVGIKSDGLGIINSGSVVDGKVVINETQQMTAAVGKAVFELLIDSQTHGTANFVVLVEEKPGNNADMSESDLSLLQEAIDATSPLPTGGSVGQVLTKTANGSAWSDAGTPTQEQVASAVSDWADEHITVSTGVVIDTSLAVAGAAADAKKVGDEISDLKSAIAQGGGFSTQVRTLIETLFRKVAIFVGNDADATIDALHDAMFPPAGLDYISVVYTQSGTVMETDSLDSLKPDLVVTAHYDNSTTEVVTDYILSGTLTEGTSVITVLYGGKSTTFNVTVTGIPQVHLEQGEYTFSDGSKVTIGANNHVTIYNGSASSKMINASSLSNNTSTVTNAANVNNQTTELLSLSTGDVLTASIKNATTDASSWAGGAQYNISVNIRKKSATTSLLSTAVQVYPKENTVHAVTTENTVTETMSADIIGSCVLVYVGGSYPTGSTIEFDLEITY